MRANIAITTPTSPISGDVKKFCKSISHKVPVFLPFTEIDPRYQAGTCYPNVLHCVKHNGGSPQYGWLIWQSIVHTEAEHHSVWKHPDGRLLDITPRFDGETMVLFLPDNLAPIERGPTDDLGWNNIVYVPSLSGLSQLSGTQKGRRVIPRAQRPPRMVSMLTSMDFSPTVSLADGKE